MLRTGHATRPAYELLREGAAHVEVQDRHGRALHVDAAGRLWGCALGVIAIAAEGAPGQARVSRDYRAASRARYLRMLTADRPAVQPCPGRGRWPWQGRHRACDRIARLGNQVAHLNDRHQWSFERIASWLEREHPDWEVPIEFVDAEAGANDQPGVIDWTAYAEALAVEAREEARGEAALAAR